MQLYRIILPVPDLTAAAAFYEAVLQRQGQRVSPGRHYMHIGPLILALYSPEEDGDPIGDGWRFHENQYLYFAVPDLEATLQRVTAAGGRIDQDIAEMPWGERLFYARDPSGAPISFVDERTLFRG